MKIFNIAKNESEYEMREEKHKENLEDQNFIPNFNENKLYP